MRLLLHYTLTFFSGLFSRTARWKENPPPLIFPSWLALILFCQQSDEDQVNVRQINRPEKLAEGKSQLSQLVSKCFNTSDVLATACLEPFFIHLSHSKGGPRQKPNITPLNLDLFCSTEKPLSAVRGWAGAASALSHTCINTSYDHFCKKKKKKEKKSFLALNAVGVFEASCLMYVFRSEDGGRWACLKYINSGSFW